MSEWMLIEGWPHYEVSRDGQVRKMSGALVTLTRRADGYMQVRLSGPRAMKRVHRLVAKAFVPNPKNLPTINHINNDRSSNHASNLEWCTQAQNIAHADKQGRMQRDYWVGKRSPSAKLNDDAVRGIRACYALGGISLEAVGRQFGVSKRTAQRCVNREHYQDVV